MPGGPLGRLSPAFTPRGKALASRGQFLIKRSFAVLLYLVALGAAVFGMLRFEALFFKGIGLALLVLLAYVAFEVFAEGVFYLRRAFDYGAYHREWEEANDPGDRIA